MGVGSLRVPRFVPARITFLYPALFIPTISRIEEVSFFIRGVPFQCMSSQDYVQMDYRHCFTIHMDLLAGENNV